MKILKEFKEFITKGNILDLAVGVIVGGAFTKIVTAFTTNIIMPFITIITGKVTVSELTFTVWNTIIPYGEFLQAVIDFLLTAAVLFIVLKVITETGKKMEALRKKQEEEEPLPAPEPSEEVKLLSEIRDLLQNK